VSDPAEEFEAVWAVVRRLEAHLRRLEATVSALRTELDLLKAARAADQASVESTSPADPLAQEPPFEEPPPDAALAEPPTYRLVFDGGSLGNPGRGYGSYHVTSPRGGTLHERLEFDDRGTTVTNNQAEYLALIRGLERLRDLLGERAGSASVEILGDSQLVINQLNGRWKVRNAELQPLHEQARALLAGFGRSDLRWHDRSHSVDLLGH